MADLDNVFAAAQLLQPTDRLRLIVRLWASLPPEHWAAPTDDELAEVARRLRDYDSGKTDNAPWDIVPRLLKVAARSETNDRAPRRQHLFAALLQPSTGASKLYSAPRRFDLATIFVVTAAYSILFTALRMLDFGPLVMLFFGALVTTVGVGQALLFGGNVPRAASVVTGAAFTAICWTGYWFVNPYGGPLIFIAVLINGSIGGAIIGYLAGVMVGGVFLVADALRQRYGQDECQDETAGMAKADRIEWERSPSAKGDSR